jgi:UDP-N-acetylmuramate dehydrogenase
VSLPASVIAEVTAAVGPAAVPDAPLGPLTTYRVGGPAAVLVRAESVDDLTALGRALASVAPPVPVVVVGRGSNLLVADRGFAGVAVVLGEGLAAVAVDVDRTTVTAGGAASLPVVARRSAADGLTGFEWAVGVPGSVGGAVRMNAGGHGSDMAATLRRVRVVDLRSGEDEWMSVGALELGYRRSALAPHQAVVTAELALTEGDRAAAVAEISEIVRWRREHQPGGANAGSVFTNPPGDSAGRLLDVAGAKGRRHGTAEVSTKHANFIQADEGGSADDVVALMGELRALVHERTGIDLRAETHLLGVTAAAADVAGARLLTGLEGLDSPGAPGADRNPRSVVEG